MEGEFVAAIETWGSGDQMMDILTLNDGKVLLITAGAVTLFDDRQSFDAGQSARALER
jgi:hypothetical protein